MLQDYTRKRDFDKTPEPSGAEKSDPSLTNNLTKNRGPSLTFVIQKHAARRLHYDFRLEIDGVMVSWAVPKGPSLNPADKRLAVMTEDHPMAYSEFEGIIPERQYGAGRVIIWDQGTYSPDEEKAYSWDNKGEANRRMREGLKRGKLSFYLRGERLKGSWTLVKLNARKKDENENTKNEWLLIKHTDQFVDTERDVTAIDTSVVSGRTLDSLTGEGEVVKGESKSVANAGQNAGKIAAFPKSISPMLAALADAPFKSEDWFFEPKLDGVRAIAFLKDGTCQLRSRRGNDFNGHYPSVVQALNGYSDEFVFDGEVVALDSKGRPSFQNLQQSTGVLRSFASSSNTDTIVTIIYYVFDILYARGKDLTNLAIEQRKDLLDGALKTNNTVKLVHSLGHDGEAAFQACVENGLEGIVGKRLNSAYELDRRSKSWLKVKTNQSGDFLICGFTEGTGSRRATFGSLILGEYDSKGSLAYVGGAGTGLDAKKLDYLVNRMSSLVTKNCPFKNKPPGKLNPTWVKPELVVEVKYFERTHENILRFPVYMHLREDIKPENVKEPIVVHINSGLEKPGLEKPSLEKPGLEKSGLEKSSSKSLAIPAEQEMRKQAELDEELTVEEDKKLTVLGGLEQFVLDQLQNEKEKLSLEVEDYSLPLTNLNKIFWPAYNNQPAITKRDYIIYLAKVSSFVIPHLTDRLITLVRFPNGIHAGRFYQKHWEKGLPKFVQTVRVFTEHERRDQDFLVCNNLPTLLWLGQIADLELHTSHTRISPAPDASHLPMTMTGSVEELEASIMNYPDYVVLDLDPYLYSGLEQKGAEPELHRQGFKNCCDVAIYLKKLLDSLKLDSFVKTSGKTGLHIYIPIMRTIDYDTVRALSEIICRQVLKDHPDEVTMDWAIVKRTGRVFMDHNMNARSKSLASIYSPRVAPEACVSTPLHWDELRQTYPTDFDMTSLPQRLALKGDLWRDILSHKHDLKSMLSRDNKDGMADGLAAIEEKSTRSKTQRSKRLNSRKQDS